MASYTELRELSTNSDLKNKVQVAVWIAAQSVIDDPENFPSDAGGNTDLVKARKLWAAGILNISGNNLSIYLNTILAANKNLTKEQILNASDIAIQNAINKVIDVIAEAQFLNSNSSSGV